MLNAELFLLLWSARIRTHWNYLLIYIKILTQTVRSVFPGETDFKGKTFRTVALNSCLHDHEELTEILFFFLFPARKTLLSIIPMLCGNRWYVIAKGYFRIKYAYSFFLSFLSSLPTVLHYSNLCAYFLWSLLSKT